MYCKKKLSTNTNRKLKIYHQTWEQSSCGEGTRQRGTAPNRRFADASSGVASLIFLAVLNTYKSMTTSNRKTQLQVLPGSAKMNQDKVSNHETSIMNRSGRAGVWRNRGMESKDCDRVACCRAFECYGTTGHVCICSTARMCIKRPIVERTHRLSRGTAEMKQWKAVSSEEPKERRRK